MNQVNKGIVAVGLLAWAASAAAVPIQGTIRFSGGVDSFDTSANTVNVTDQQGIVSIPQPDGTFAIEGLTSGTVGTYNNFNYNQPITGGSINPLWSVNGTGGTFAFELTQINFVDESVPEFLDLQGTGLMTFSATSSLNSYDPTTYLWSMSIDTVNGNITFSSTNVPEPGVALLIGIGLAGVVASRRKTLKST